MDTTSATAPKTFRNETNFNYKHSEFYTIFLSVLTAALLLLFIMWRWYRMKSDLRRAIEEFQETQNLINQQQQAAVAFHIRQNSFQSINTSQTQHFPISSNNTNSCANIEFMKISKNDLPPPYEQVIKSTSLPNYHSILNEKANNQD